MPTPDLGRSRRSTSQPSEPQKMQGSGDLLSFFRSPVDNARVNSAFGFRSVPKGTKSVNMVGGKQLNTGIDLGGKIGDQIKAAAPGKVVSVVTNPKDKAFRAGWGKHVLVEHDVNGQKVYTRYSHLNDVAGLKVGQSIGAGTLLGFLGKSGNATGPHLDFEMFTKDAKGRNKFIDTNKLFGR